MRKPSILCFLFLVFMLCKTAGLFDGMMGSKPNHNSNRNAAALRANQDRQTSGMGLTARGVLYSLIVVGGTIGAWIGMAFVRSSDRKAVQQMTQAGTNESLDQEIAAYTQRFHTS